MSKMHMKQKDKILACVAEGSNRCPCGLEDVCGTNDKGAKH
jgi:hypothetical protein